MGGPPLASMLLLALPLSRCDVAWAVLTFTIHKCTQSSHLRCGAGGAQMAAWNGPRKDSIDVSEDEAAMTRRDAKVTGWTPKVLSRGWWGSLSGSRHRDPGSFQESQGIPPSPGVWGCAGRSRNTGWGGHSGFHQSQAWKGPCPHPPTPHHPRKMKCAHTPLVGNSHMAILRCKGCWEM